MPGSADSCAPCRFIALAITAAFLTGCAAAPSPSAPDVARTREQLATDTFLDSRSPPYQFEERPLGKIMGFFSEITEGQLRFHKDPDLMCVDGELYTRCFPGGTWREALDFLFEHTGLSWSVLRDGTIYFSTPEGIALAEGTRGRAAAPNK
jgi:hypothetical protein